MSSTTTSTDTDPSVASTASDDPLERLQAELDRTKEEKEKLATQYRNLLAKLTQMRTTLGNKLQQDAEELDRREQTIQQLTLEKDDLVSTVDTLQSELVQSNQEAERLSTQLDSLRTRALQENAQETLHRERELRETQSELERCRVERDEWERMTQEEKVVSEDLRVELEDVRREMGVEKEARMRAESELEREKEKSENLQSVLQDFQSAKDHELRQAVTQLESQLLQATQSLAEFKHRALTAELKLEESSSNLHRTQDLEKEIKDKNLLIGKLRHEAVIINEHLMEALRRLRRSSTENNVDKRLVTNVILSFLSTPRADSKRFEMLSLLASILGWSESEKEKAGLQRGGHGGDPGGGGGGGFWGRGGGMTSPSIVSPTAAIAGAGTGNTDETESFSRLWVEFLLTEAASGTSTTDSTHPSSQHPHPHLPSSHPAHLHQPQRTTSSGSLGSFFGLGSASSTTATAAAPNGNGAGSPTHSQYSSSSLKGQQQQRRLGSLSGSGVAGSTPNLLSGSGSRKGKEKERGVSEEP